MQARNSRFILSSLLALGASILPACRVDAELTGGSFVSTGLDTTSRFFHRAGLLPGGDVVVSGGMSFNPLPPSLLSLDDLSFYDPDTGTFTTSFTPTGGGPPVTPVLATPRSSHTQTTLRDGRVLFTGGHTGASGSNVGTAIASVEIFDPMTGLVEPGPAMSTNRAGHTATVLADGATHDMVIAAGGGTWEIYRTSTGQWSPALPLAHSRSNHAAVAFAVGGGGAPDRVLLIGGSGSGPTTLEVLDPQTGSSTLLGSTLAVGVDDLAAARLEDGRVLIVGGQNLVTGDTIGDSYCYDLAADVLTAVASPPGIPAGLADHQLVVIGRHAFVFGGESQTNGVDTELVYAAGFDGGSDQWVFDSSMVFPHDDFAAVRLSDDRVVLIDGGAPFLGNEIPTRSVELFTPEYGEPADLDCDGVVGFQDLLELLVAWGPCVDPPGVCVGDLDDDGEIGFGDLLLLLVAWS